MGLRVSGQARVTARPGRHAARPGRRALPGSLRPPPSGVLPHSPAPGRPPEPREAQAGSRPSSARAATRGRKCSAPAVPRGRSRRAGGARKVRARWRPPGPAAGEEQGAALRGEGRGGSPPSPRSPSRSGCDACRLEPLTSKRNCLICFCPGVFVLFLVFGWDESFRMQDLEV